MGDKAMETEILKIICANQGAVDTKYLMSNLGFGESATEIISNPEKFAFCCPFGQPKVVARTSLKLCRAKACLGTCKALHLCKNFLFSGSCKFSQMSYGCKYSHDLSSSYNQTILQQYELESLSRTELCTILLQSENNLLPSVCHNYNNGPGLYGKCLDGDVCSRLHICERSLNRGCNCPKTHDFNAQQPLTFLQAKGVPDDLFPCLKSVYANKAALRFNARKGDGGNKDNQQQLDSAVGESSVATDNIGTSWVAGQNWQQKEWLRGRGRGGFRGNRGNRGARGNRRNQDNRPLQKKTLSSSDIASDFDLIDLYSDGGPTEGNSDLEQANNTPVVIRGGGGNRLIWSNQGNQQELQQSSSDTAAVNADANRDDGPSRRSRPVRDKTEICLYFIKGHCIHGDERCYKVHDKMPYRWEVNVDGQWTALDDNETIEKAYCDPKNTYSSSSPSVHFDTMTQGQNKVRRLSTMNSLLQPDFIHTTEWLWYWEDEFGTWNVYASAIGGHKQADMDSDTLEQKFLDNDKDVVVFKAGSQTYSLSFQDMIQTNQHYGTKRLVKRLPRFFSAADVRAKRVRRPPGQSSFAALPDYWDKTQVPQTGYKRVSLLPSSDEFKEIEALFGQTVRGFDIVKIERIQNKALWEVFQWQRSQMVNNNKGRNVTEKKLFHGTDSKFVDVISHTNFDWRICGTHGTAYGKGSYFARDARYSHNYTGDSDVRSMFVARVLVGHYTRGSSDYRRPPSKDGGDINFYDSCVDDVLTPSIFVVFEKHQIYPEYLLQYKTTDTVSVMYGTSSGPAYRPVVAPTPVVAPRPVIAPKPVIAPRPVIAPTPAPAPRLAPNPIYQPSSPAYSPPKLSYQPSTSTYQYQTRTPASQFTQSSPSPTPKPKKQSDSCVIA
ncbi:protein mono-ADP-ribosyltransferase PARP12 [Notolabrus celidotus]|uniref:protein mono-ADP-ribosyltransferase PARP12 n=1 Tax=Notolabrus celidotus TaxID=1203425 RepID=UPI00148FADF6|nr:protein mono-ADP-ribosyltransferase PARP12 [Notolabrus celidotus]